MQNKTKIVILGAGPTGLSLAAQLIRFNIDFVILEKNEKTTHLSKAIAVQARTLEIFDELGIAHEAVKQGQVTTGINLFHNGSQQVAVNLSGLGEGLSAFPFVLSLEQSKTEKLLVDYLTANKHGVQWNSTFTHYKQDRDNVKVYYNDAAGQSHQVEADYLVGCDGAGSLLRHQMGLSFEGDTVPKIFYVADVSLKSSVINKNELFMFLIKKGFILFFPMEPRGHYRIIGILSEVSESPEQLAFSDIESAIREGTQVPIEFKQVSWLSSYKVHSRKANSFENGRCYIAGDAAHIHTPAGGQGMNTGIQDSYNLAWKIAFKLEGITNAEVLKTYSSERCKNAHRLLQTTDKMFDLMAGTTPFWNFVRINFFARIIRLVAGSGMVRKRLFPLLSQIGISYNDSYLTIPSSVGKVKAGVRMPYFTFSDGRQILDFLREPAFKVLYFGKREFDKSRQLLEMKFPIVTKSFTEIPSALFADEENFYLLLRPDNHISYIGKEINVCRDFFIKISGSETNQ